MKTYKEDKISVSIIKIENVWLILSFSFQHTYIYIYVNVYIIFKR